MWSNQLSFIGLVSSKNYFERPNGLVCLKDRVGVSFEIGSCVQRKWVVGSGLHGYFREQGQSVGVHLCLE